MDDRRKAATSRSVDVCSGDAAPRARVQHFDHHVADEITRHPHLHAKVDFSRGVCTSLVVDRVLGGQYRGLALGLGLGLGAEARVRLRQLGELIRYNANRGMRRTRPLRWHPIGRTRMPACTCFRIPRRAVVWRVVWRSSSRLRSCSVRVRPCG